MGCVRGCITAPVPHSCDASHWSAEIPLGAVPITPSFWSLLGCSSYWDFGLWVCNNIPIQAPIWWVYCQRFWLVPFLLCNPSFKELKYQRFHLRFAACPSISKSAFSVVKISPSFVSRKSIMKCQFSVHFHFQPYSPQLKVGWWKVQCRTFTCC